MKIDRLIGILAILLQQEKVTAPYLADKFEVSRRTINRDIEDLCKAGIPLMTTQGKHGGISIMEGYKIERTLLTSFDMQAILAGLKSLDSVSGTSRYQQLMEKLSFGSSGLLPTTNHILIDLSSWYKNTLAPKIELIQAGIEGHQKISFQYHSPKGESSRIIEPYFLIFQWSSWYARGYCMERKAFRLFKLNRMVAVECSGEKFEPRPVPVEEIGNCLSWPTQIRVVVVFEPSAKWRVIDEYGIDSFTEREDGSLLFEFAFEDKNSVFSWLLTFGTAAQLCEPVELRAEFGELLAEMGRKYQQELD